MRILYKVEIGYLIFFSLSSCKEDRVAKETVSNQFQMDVSGKPWMPTSLGKDDECMQAFYAYSSYAIANSGQEVPYYTVRAYQDSLGRTDLESESIYELRVWDLRQTGLYYLNGGYEFEFSSYICYKKTMPDGIVRRYINSVDENRRFTVKVDDFIPIEGSSLLGISGSFYGPVFNEKDPNDSLIISNGNFHFEKVNYYNFNQCLQK